MSYIETKEEFAGNIKYVRESLELSHQKVADQLGIDRSTYTYYETGKTEMSLFHLIELENRFLFFTFTAALSSICERTFYKV